MDQILALLFDDVLIVTRHKIKFMSERVLCCTKCKNMCTICKIMRVLHMKSVILHYLFIASILLTVLLLLILIATTGANHSSNSQEKS